MKHEKTAGFENVRLKDGFWLDRYELNKRISVGSVLKRFEETGRVDALRFNNAETGKPLHMYYDSDMYKWIEAVAYLYALDPVSQKDNVKLIDELTERMAKAQTADGYINSYHQQIEPQNIFKLRDHHELYTIGHMIEAAVAYARYVGKNELQDIAEKACDCVYRAFISEKTAAFVTPGMRKSSSLLLNFIAIRAIKNTSIWQNSLLPSAENVPKIASRSAMCIEAICSLRRTIRTFTIFTKRQDTPSARCIFIAVSRILRRKRATKNC